MTNQKSKPIKHLALTGSLALLMTIGGTLTQAKASTTMSIAKVTKSPLGARQAQITGTVTSATDQSPLPGVSVLVKGTNQGVTTNEKGQYTIKASPTDILVFSYIGFLSTEKPVGNTTSLNVVLQEDNQSLDEVVVVGYGTQRKVDITGSVAGVKSEELTQRPAQNVNQALSGRIAGVNASTNSGRPGGRTQVRIRGFSSINATNEPLYVVDGIIFTEDISTLNPGDIESVDVLKDASATAIYGTRGANGVIMITTKRGKSDQNQISYDAFMTVNKMARKQDVLNSAEWMEIEALGYRNAAKYDPEGFAAGRYEDPAEKHRRYAVGNTLGNRELFNTDGTPLYDVDWQDLLTRTSIGQSHNLSFTGGSERSTYGLYLGYFDDQGIIVNSFQKRYSARAVIDNQVRDWLKVGGTISYSNNTERRQDDGVGGNIPPRMMIEMVPFIPYQYPDGTYGRREDYDGLETGDNPRAQADEITRLYRRNVFTGNAYARATILEGLDFTTTIGANVRDQHQPYFASSFSNFDGGLGRSFARIGAESSFFWQWSNHLNYNKTFGDHHISATLGTEAQKFEVLNWEASANDIADDFYQWNNLGMGATPMPPTSSIQNYQMNSYFARANYSYKDKYLLTVTGRFDGSSRFGENNKFAFFPSAAAAWRISEEDFLKGNETVSNLKLRLSYGLTGNSEIDSYLSRANLQSGNYVFDGRLSAGTVINTLPNPNLKWEKTAQYNAGFDLGLLNDRINIVFDAYIKKTSDLLLAAPVPASSGYTTLMTNIGDMKNSGFEFGINTVNIDRGDFSWTSALNFSYLKNEVTALGTNNEDVFMNPFFIGSNSNILRVGNPVGSFYGLIREGTWSTAEEAEAARYNRLPGDIKYRDLNDDGQINDADRTILGKGIPDFYGGFFNTFRYKNLDLTLELQYSYGNDVFRMSQHSAEDRTGIANSYATVLNAWTPENQNTPIAEIRGAGVRYDTLLDSHKVEDGSFIRGKNLMLGYNFSSDALSKIKLSRLRLYASVQNFFLITDYSGYDPEVTTYDDTFAQGIEFHDYPKPMTFTFGVNATF
ncbi:TonB-dependent receptor [Olivibacter sp. XZL3]|uniref:SusC/RagA family TonB-linked outer membrane protein n=1 Tax=Olivibacter sp. XZL3 TaxID=1735116 RepID=UPI001065E4D3|nr:TonB-dependent receptor [Olivibacter sp. XZL3]